jgi:hypothetical protein
LRDFKTVAEAEAFLQVASEFPSKAEFARHLGKSVTTVKDTLTRAKRLVQKGDEPIRPMPEVPEEAEEPKIDPAEHERLRRANVRLETQQRHLTTRLRELDQDNLSAEHVREAIFHLKAESSLPPDWLIDDRPGKGVSGVPCTIWSDWHLGEVVSRAETNGINEFNLSIADTRIRRLVSRTIDLCFNHMTGTDYPGLVVNLIGDIVSGSIHDELTRTNEITSLQVVVWARDRICWALSQMADKFGKVFVIGVPGNHGRTTKRIESKTFVYQNYDWLIYTLCEAYFKEAGDERVRFYVPVSGDAYYNVYSHRYLAIHGHDLGVKGGDGIIGALGPIQRGAIKTQHSSSQVQRDFDTLLLGHWHQELWLPKVFVNNTLKGFDEFALKFLRAPASAPSQSLWFTHPKHGITARWSVFLEDRQRVDNPEWVSWAS